MSTDGFLDGNAAAGPLHDLFAVDLTAASGQCDGCGLTGRVAEAHVYADAPGIVVRCRGCEAVLLRVVSAPGRTWLDMRGLRYLQVSTG
jgi:uncharacterized protein DUF6510